jgi:hypothetical protein
MQSTGPQPVKTSGMSSRSNKSARATITQATERVQLSNATASRALNNVAHQLGLAARRRVLQAIRELDFRRNALARSLHQRRTHTSALIIPDISKLVNPPARMSDQERQPIRSPGSHKGGERE